jgi:hypothetical protein
VIAEFSASAPQVGSELTPDVPCRAPILISLMLFASAASAPAKVDYSGHWQLVDVAANPPRPISSATILVTYVGTSGNIAHSTRSCYGFRLLNSDADGRFHVPAGGAGEEILVAAHKPGFAVPSGKSPVQALKKLAILTSDASRNERALHYRTSTAIAACRGSAAIQFLDGLLPEIESFATSPDEVEIVEQIRADQRNRF